MARVLIVEPHDEVRALIALIVSSLGHEALVHDRGLPDEVDALILEPAHSSGYRIASNLRERDPNIPIVITSVYPPDQRSRSLDPTAFLVKPFELAALRETLIARLGTPVVA